MLLFIEKAWKKSSSTKGEVKSSNIRNLDWKNEEEVKEYLENLYVEYSFQCISEKRADGCHRLANFLENIRAQYTEATDLYKKNCDENKHGPSCLTYAKNRSLGRGCNQNLTEACKYSFICCDEYKLTEGCLNAGICMSEGVGGTNVNVRDSLKYLDRACDDKNPYACLKLFKIFIEGAGNVSRNAPKAFDYTKRACECNDLLGCMNASLMLKKGDGVKQNDKLADEYREKAENIRKELETFREKFPIDFGQMHK